MPEDHRDYRVMELSIYCRNKPNLASGTETVKEGDIIGIRTPLGYIGKSEAAQYLWLLVEGLDYSDMLAFKNVFAEGIFPNEIFYEKRQYCIPLKRLKEVAPFIDLNRVRDKNDEYQPFLSIDPDWPFYRLGTEGHSIHGLMRLPTGVIARPPLDVHGLVFNKKTMRFI